MTTTIVRCVIGALALSNAAFASPLSTSPFPPDYQKTMPLAPIVSSSPAFINNSYIVVLKDGISPAALYQHSLFVQDAHDADPLAAEDSGLRHVYDGKLKGYAGHFTEQTIEKIRAQPEVDYIERDQVVWALETQRGAPWGLARISHRPRLTFGTFTKYEYDSTAGQGVDVYVIDTGIFVDHEQFEGRARWGKTIPKDASDSDGNGHGTHCAGTIASKKYGVAKAANVIAVKVLGDNGSGSMSDVVSGVVWAAEQAAAKAKLAAAEFVRTGVAPAHKGSVASMSLGGGKSRALDDMVNRAVDSGLHFAVAAGNDNRDACDYSPAAAEKAITVGASTLGDERAYFSNHGPCVDVFAPGLNILSTWIGHKDATNTISGTSMATPHTAGLLAYLLSIYPSKSFDPKIEESFDPAAAAAFLSAVGTTTNPAFSSVLNIAHATLPNWVTSYLPSLPVVNDDAAPKLPTLTPAQLKKALLALSTPDMLSELPAKTVNKLIFNNATSFDSAEAWAKVLEA